MTASGEILGVLEQFQRIVASDGGRIDLVSAEAGTVRLRYAPGAQADCAQCVMSREDLQALLTEALQRRDASVREVEVELAPA